MLKIIPKAITTFRFSAASFHVPKNCFCDTKDGKSKPKDIYKVPEDKKSKDLNELLTSMSIKENQTGLKKVPVQKAGASRKFIKPKEMKQLDSSDDEKKPKSIKEAVKKITSGIGTDETVKSKEIESELLNKLLNITDTNSSSLADLIINMQVDHEDKKPSGTFTRQQLQTKNRVLSKADMVRRSLEFSGSRSRFSDQDRDARQVGNRRNDYQRPPREQLRVLQANISGKSVNLFESEPLGIFKNIEQSKDIDLLPTWNELAQSELKQTVTHPPTNYFEKMCLWTEQGKLWKFPINNEHGLDEEAKIYFTEHIFLEHHLESWCPSRGPIRHFMELVCVGLSKNYHISAKEKVEHINWFKDYFAQKKDILESVIQDSKSSSSSALNAKV